MIKITIDHYNLKDMNVLCRTTGNNPLKIKMTAVFVLICTAVLIITLSEWAVLAFTLSIIFFIEIMFLAPGTMLMSSRSVQKKNGGSLICVCFTENDWTISIGNETETISYTSTYGAEEKGEYFFISRQKGSHFCVPKRCFTENTPDELRQLLTDKLGSKFEVKP